MKHIICLIITTVIAFYGTAQNRYYVKPSANGQNNGSSWQDAFTDLHHALATAQVNDAIWVAEGEYRPDTATNRDRSFVLKSGVKLFGGFAGTETSLHQRELALHATILSGNIGNPADSTDNAYTILYMSYPDTSTYLDGLIFRHGFAKSDTNSNQISPVQSGGAVFVVAQGGKGMPTFSNCIFRDNYAQSFGGAYFVYALSTAGSTPIFRNCTFFNNKAGRYGGAVYVAGGNSYDRGIEFDHCKFDLNTALGFYGGGIYMSNNFGPETLNFLGCDVSRSKASLEGAFLYMWRIGTNTVRLDIDSCTLQSNGINCRTTFELSGFTNERQNIIKINNSKFLDDGAVISPFLWYSALPYHSPISDTFLVSNNVFARHKSSSIMNVNANHVWAKIDHNLFIQNEGIYFELDRSSAIFVWGTNVEISKNMFIGNKTPIDIQLTTRPDASLLIEGNLFYGNEKWIDINIRPNVSSPALAQGYIVNNTFIDNIILPDGAGTPVWVTRNNVFNNIFVGNKSATTGLPTLPLRLGLDTLYFSNNLFDDTSFCTSYSNVTCGPNNLFNLEPQFRDPANGDYSLLPCSPLINAGSNLAAAGLLTDLAGNPRIQDGTVDIGAYESPAFSLASEPVVKPACVGESNGSISISPVFGCEPYIYNWSPQAGTGPELSGLLPGSYLLTLTDGSGRQILDTVQVSTASLPELSTSSTDVDCTSGLGGSITALVNNGAAPYHFQWLPAAADTAYLGQLPPGNYALTVTDINGCRDSASASLALQGLLSLMVDGQIIRCFGETGWLSATPVTGLAPFSWAWTGWPGTDARAEPLGPGNYSVTVTDAYGCTSSKTFPPMTEPGLLTIGTGSSDQTQTNPPNGAAVVTTVSGGTAPFGYQWDMGSTAQAIGGLLAGTYTVTVTDKNGCEAVAEVVVDLMVGTGEAAGEAVLMYPNPAADWVRITCSEPSEGNWVTLLDASGRVLRSQAMARGSEAVMLDLGGLPAGDYWVMIRNQAGQELYSGKVLKF